MQLYASRGRPNLRVCMLCTKQKNVNKSYIVITVSLPSPTPVA